MSDSGLSSAIDEVDYHLSSLTMGQFRQAIEINNRQIQMIHCTVRYGLKSTVCRIWNASTGGDMPNNVSVEAFINAQINANNQARRAARRRTGWPVFDNGAFILSVTITDGQVIDELLIEEEIADLLLFESSNFKAGTFTSLAEYVERMQTDQKSIYYLFAPSRQLAESSPYYEMFKSRNMEVLFLHDPADELVFISMPQYRLKNLESVEQWAKTEGVDADAAVAQGEVTRDPSKREFLDWVRETLGSVRATAVRPMAARGGGASEHPFVLTVQANMGAARHMLRISDFKEQEHLVLLQPVVHVNFSHPLVAGLIKLRKTDAALAKKIAEQAYDNALITAGLLKDSSQMVGRINQILGELMKAEKSPILTP